MTAFLCFTKHRRFGQPLLALLLGQFQQFPCLLMRVGHDRVPLFKDSVCFPHVGRYSEPQLVDDVEYPFPVDDQVATGQAPRLDDDFFQAVNEVEDIHAARVPPGSVEAELLPDRRSYVHRHKPGDVVPEA